MHRPLPHRLLAACTAVAVAASACGSSEAGAPADHAPDRTAATEAADPVEGEDDGTVAEVGLVAAARAPRPAAPPEQDVPSAPPVEVPSTVEVSRPDVLVHSGPMARTDVAEALGLEGIERLAAASRFPADLRFADRTMIVEVLAVDPTTFRPLTPEVTAQTPAVWQRLIEGDVLVRHDVAHELGLGLGGDVVLAGPTGTRTVRVGAFASNGAPPVADVIVPEPLGADLGAPGINTLLVAVAEGADAAAVGASVAAAVGADDVEVLAPPVEQEAWTVATGDVRIEPFRYTDLGDGLVVIDPAWVRTWIVVVDLPRVGRTRVHRLMAPQLLAAFEQIEREGLLPHLDPAQFGGGWVPRHIDWDPSKPLSMHAWGLAIDLNTHDNWLGETPQMDPRVVEIMESWGFAWGGRWRRPDGMHFELDRVVDVDG